MFSFPEKPAWDNFINAIKKGNLFLYMKNDLIISCIKVPIGIFVEALAAFALTRLKLKHKTGIFIFFLVGMMLPMQTHWFLLILSIVNWAFKYLLGITLCIYWILEYLLEY